ncbi:T9SS type A sorting domain-containing protein [candidate division KSB1 bacterium]|nr:T9SS type A sorting domain-containing protein [candidate division KSB1 bacterium]
MKQVRRLCLMLLAASTGFAQLNTLGHEYEPVVVRGALLSLFNGVAFDDLFIYRFLFDSQTWEQIPFQFDDVGADESYFSENDGLLDADDELVFMAADIGDRAPTGAWIADGDARIHARYELQVTDGSNSGLRGWVYLYRSAVLTPQFTQDYVSADLINDGIQSSFYYLTHNTHGAMDQLRITSAGGGNNADIVDREKVRILGTIYSLPYELNEDTIVATNHQFKDGPVRVLRQVSYQLSSLGASFQKDISERYYDRLSITGGSIGHIDPSYGVTYMRQSLDLNSAAIGMMFFSPVNSGITIDGIPDAPVTILPTSGITWNQLTGSQGTIVQVVNLPDLGNPQYLYYRDNSAGGSGDATLETGDSQSFGDVGVSFQNPNTGVFALGFLRYFLPGNLASSVGSELADHATFPMQISSAVQQPPTTDNVAFRIINPRLDGNIFRWDLEVNRLDDWGAGQDAVLGDVQLFFNINPAGFSSIAPTLSDVNSNIVGNFNYSLTSGRAGSSLECAYIQIDYTDAGGTNWYPDLNVWQPLLTASLPITVFTENSGLTWRDGATFAAQGSDLGLIITTSGDGEIDLPVELASFTAHSENGWVKLQWITRSETENLGFHIYRSELIEGLYDQINDSLLPGAGDSQSEHRYSYIDKDVQAGNTYYYKLADVDYQGRINMHGPIAVTAAQPLEYSLQQNFPNPFNPVTSIRFIVGESGLTRLSVFDLRGRLVRLLVDRHLQTGQHEIAFDGMDERGMPLPSGTYHYRLQADGFQQTRRMQLLR